MEIKTKSKKQFLRKLADLMEEYNVNICSKESGKYSKVVFQMHDMRKGKSHLKEDLDTGRCHSSPYEIRLIAKHLNNTDNRKGRDCE